jgi:protocatechuate 3,4-dioxygenase beta subunit
MNENDKNEPDRSRREVVILIGSLAAGMFGCGSGSTSSPTSPTSPTSTPAISSSPAATGCVVRPALTEGPYFVDERLNRSDIRTDPADGSTRPGVPLRLTFRVTRSSGSTCATLAGVFVDVWHCDALGTYSDVQGASGRKFLRGYQVTDASGTAQFTTIFPGWYSGRAIHLHFKIRTSLGGGDYEFTSQLFFDESVTAAVLAQSPYNTKGQPDTSNARDGIYQGGGSQLLVTPVAEGSGYGVTFDIALQY